MDFFVQNLESENCLVVPPVTPIAPIAIESPEGEGYHRDTGRAFVQFLASTYKSIQAV